MKAGACWGKANTEKNLQEYCAKDRENKKIVPYKSASYPAAVSETPVRLRQHYTTAPHQGRRLGVVFQLHGKAFGHAEDELQLPLKPKTFRGVYSCRKRKTQLDKAHETRCHITTLRQTSLSP